MKTASFRVDSASLNESGDEPRDGQAGKPAFFARLYDWIDYHLNPVLLKDIRGWLRSKVFLIVFFLGLAAATATTVICALVASIEVNIGSQLFAFLVSGLGFFMGGGVPYLMQEKLAEELENHSTELAFISRLTPAQFVRGKILSGLSVSMLFLAAASPGLTVAYMLGGVGVDVMAYCLVSLVVLSVTSMMLGILFVSMRGKKRLRLISLGLFAAGVGISSLEAVFAMEGSRGRLFREDEFIIFNAVILIHLIPALYFLYTVAVCRLSFTTDNREAKPRIALSVFTLVSYLCIFFAPCLVSLFDVSLSHGVMIISGPAAIVAISFFIVGFLLIADTEETLSMRLKAGWPRSFIKRMLLYPGRGRLYAYLCFHLFLFVGAAALSGLQYDRLGLRYAFDEEISTFSLGWVFQFEALIAGCILACEWLRSIGLRLPRSILILTLALLWSILGLVIMIVSQVFHWPQWTWLISPPTAMGFLGDSFRLMNERLVVAVLSSLVVLIPAGIMFLIHILAAIREDREVSALVREKKIVNAVLPCASESAIVSASPSVSVDASSVGQAEEITIDLKKEGLIPDSDEGTV